MKIVVYDHGLCTEVAITLARAGHSIGYFTPWDGDPQPEVTKSVIGSGLEGIERIPTNHMNRGFWQAVSRADMVCFFDTNSADDVFMAKQTGKLVWGAGGAEQLENDRVFAREMMSRLDLPVVPYKVIKGIEPLMAHLKKNKGLWVKLPGEVRGNFETYKHDDWDSSAAQYFGRMLLDFGAYADELVFVVEKPLEGFEIGWDGLVVDGEWSAPSMLGIEAKDEGYVGKIVTKLPPKLGAMLGKLSGYFAQHQSKTFFSPECRVDDKGVWYLTDPCVRCPHPPTAAELCIYGNIADYIIEGTKQANRPLKPKAAYSAAVIIQSGWAEDHWTEIKIDPKVRERVKLQRAYGKDGRYYALPGQAIVATAVGLGDTLEAAIKDVTRVVDKVSCRQMSVNLHSLQIIAEETIPMAKDYGIDLT